MPGRQPPWHSCHGVDFWGACESSSAGKNEANTSETAYYASSLPLRCTVFRGFGRVPAGSGTLCALSRLWRAEAIARHA